MGAGCHVEGVVDSVVCFVFIGTVNCFQTLISFDKGSFWTPLSVDESHFDPSQNVNCTAVTNPCKLTLSLNTENALSSLPPPHSTKTAIGVILANGWVGEVPRVRPEQAASTFLSRDGGEQLCPEACRRVMPCEIRFY